MRRFLLIAGLALAVLLAVTAGAAAWLIHDTTWIKGRIDALAQKQAGRSLRIEGPLEFSLGRVTTIDAGDLRFASADWAHAEDLLRVGQLRIAVDVPSLFSDTPRLAALRIGDCALDLERDAEGRGSWELRPRPGATDAEEDAHLPFVVLELVVANCRLALAGPDGAVTLDLRVDDARLGHTADERIEAHVAGAFNGQPLSVEGWLAPSGVLARGGTVRHDLEIRAGPIALDSSGAIADVRRLAGVDLQARLHGPDIGEVLSDLHFPPFSDGPFDFRVDLDNQGGMTAIDVDGDLGSLEIVASGAVDRLRQPDNGRLEVQVQGPDLQAFVAALGYDDLVSEPFNAGIGATIEAGVLKIERAELSTAGDLIDLAGMIALHGPLGGSRLDLHLDSSEIGRWAEALHRGPGPAGAITLDSHFEFDRDGRLSIDARLEQGDARLRLHGPLGIPGQSFDARLAIDYEAPRPGPLLHWLAGRPLPDIPLEVDGTVRISEQSVRLSGLRAASGPHEVHVDGRITRNRALEGSEVALRFDSPDLSALGRSLGRDDLPAEPLRLDGTISVSGPGLAFSFGDGQLGDIRLKLDGRVADRAEPLGIDAEFDLALPGTGPVNAWLPWLRLPDGALSARGRLVNETDQTRLEGASVQLENVVARVEGALTRDRHYDFTIDGEGPDASVLSGPARLALPPDPFRVTLKLAGEPGRLDLTGIDVALGASQAGGDLFLDLGAQPGIRGDVRAALLDLDPWFAAAEEPAAPPPKRQYVFDETPVLRISDYGVEVDGRLAIDEIRFRETRATEAAVGVSLAGERLRISPFTLRGMAGGLFSGNIELDGSHELPELDLHLRGEDQALSLGAYEGQDPATLPRGTFELELTGRGNTQREMAASLDGRLRLDFGAGELALTGFDFLLSDFVTELLRRLNPFAKTDKVSHLECLVAAADVTAGKVAVGPVVVHARKVTVVSQGEIDLHNEKISLTFDSRQRKGIGVSASDLVDPFIKVGGTLAQPAMELDAAGTVVKGGLAVATAGLSILARSLAERYLASKDPCGDALKAIREKDAGER